MRNLFAQLRNPVVTNQAQSTADSPPGYPENRTTQVRLWHTFGLVLALIFISPAQAAFLIEIDTDGMDDGPISFNSHFMFGGDTTTASTSEASDAFGLAPADSIFGGDGVAEPDTYVYRYDPTTDADNLATAGVQIGVDLSGTTVNGTGLTGGSAGLYWVYASWPKTTNVSGGPTRYTVTSGLNSFSVDLNQGSEAEPIGANDPDDDGVDEWVRLGAIEYDGSSGIIVTQQPTETNSFVSMRASGVLFEPVPEPASLILACITAIGLLGARAGAGTCPQSFRDVAHRR